MDTWHDMGQAFKLRIRLDKTDFGRENPHFLLFGLETMREKRGKKEIFQTFFRQSIEFYRSEFVDPRVKVHLLDEGYAYIPKRRDFIENPKEEILGNQGFQAREASHPCYYYASRGRNSSYFSLFSTLRFV